MLTRKTQYAWMAVGGLICLFGLVLACKLRDGNRAIAQDNKADLPLPPVVGKPPALPASKETTFLSPSVDTDKSALETELPITSGKSEQKTSEFPDASKSKSVPDMLLSAPPPLPPPPVAPSTSGAKEDKEAISAPLPPSGGLPASFGPNTPTTKDEKKGLRPKLEGKFFFRKSPSEAKPNSADKVPSTAPIDSPPPAPISSPPPPLGSSSLPGEKAADPKPVPPLTLDSAPQPPVPPSTAGRELPVAPTSYAPVSPAPPSTVRDAEHEAKTQPGEPPLAPAPGPVQLYRVHGSETLQDIARRTLGSSDRWTELHKLNPTLKPDVALSAGTTVRLPGDACVQADEAEPVKPLPALRPKPAPAKVKVLPLTGTYQCSLDEKGRLTLPRALRDQFDGSDTVLLSPGPDKCLWLTNQPHLERLGERLEQSQANEVDVRVFKRLYFAQTEKLPVNGDGRVGIPERLAQFAGLHQEVVLVGIDDHFEVWDAARWRQYTQQKSAAGRPTAMAE